ncbi:MAG TPA: hypothetical protein PLX67_01195 [bacterium]|jgi:hypothetical protein|nr:hypothetical protein [bacterium]HOH85608.1 hypothetical protein [bacterium]HPW44315.1 hypothetical protein [bacterium]HPX64230.1 hypothetical protein [bacterium]HQA84093.1 hypothetical protein [bacterium]
MITPVNKKIILSGLAVFIGLEIINWRVQYLYWIIALWLILFLAIVWFSLSNRSPKYKLMVWLIPTLNLLAWCGFLTIVNSSFIRQLLILTTAAIQLAYWRRGWTAWLEQKPPAAWRRLVNAINLLTIWLAAATLYGWQAFLAWPIWWSWLWWLILSGLILWLDYQTLALPLSTHWPVVLTQWLIGGQIFLAVYFLPSSHLVLAYLLLIAYYVVSQIGRGSLLKTNTARRLRYQFLILIILLAVVLLTAKWF